MDRFFAASTKHGQAVGTFKEADSFSILFNHRSFQKPIVFSPWILLVFLEEGSLERLGKCPLEQWVLLALLR